MDDETNSRQSHEAGGVWDGSGLGEEFPSEFLAEPENPPEFINRTSEDVFSNKASSQITLSSEVSQRNEDWHDIFLNLDEAEKIADVSSQGSEVVDTFLDEDELRNQEGIPVSYHNALVLNETYQNHLKEVLNFLELSLVQNQNRQKELSSEIREIETGFRDEDDDPDYLPAHEKAGGKGATPKRAGLNIFAAPYFKDVDLFSHPDNPDTKKKKAGEELGVYLPDPKVWTAEDKKKLKYQVQVDTLEKRLAPVIGEIARLGNRVKNRLTSPGEKQEIHSRIKKLKEDQLRIEESPDEVLFEDKFEELDWYKISMESFGGQVTPFQCRIMWQNVVHPAFNNHKWTEEEVERLEEIVDEERMKTEKNNVIDWESVAVKLRTKRTGLFCLMAYQQKRIATAFKSRWTPEEDDKLRQLVEILKVNNYIPWNKVSYYMVTRRNNQCYQRYRNSLNSKIRKGNFAEVEDYVIIVGRAIFGPDWTKIKDYLRHRTTSQIHSRYNTFLKVDFSSWSEQEDTDLLNLVKQIGSQDWVAISEELAKTGSSKTRTQCRVRFAQIHRYYERDPDSFNLGLIHSNEDGEDAQDLSYQSKKQQLIYSNCDNRLKQFLVKHRKEENLNRRRKERSEMRVEESDVFHGLLESDSNDPDEPENVYTTPDGVKIPNWILLKFIKSIQEELPSKSNYSEQKIKPVRLTDDSVMTPVKYQSLFRSMQSSSNRLSKPLGTGGPKKAVSTKGIHAHLDRSLSIFFRPTWPGRVGRKKPNLTENHLKIMIEALHGYSDILKFSKMKEPTSTDSGEDVYSLARSTAPRLKFAGKPRLPTQSGSKIMKTYSRKKKGPATKAKDLPDDVKYLPPSCESLVGFRGILLHLRRLKSIVDPHSVGIKTNLDVIAKEGIYHTKTLQHSTYKVSKPVHGLETDLTRSTAEKADKLLKERFMSMFLWPAIMSSVKPKSHSREDLFLKPDKIAPISAIPKPKLMAAATPFDASGLIEKARVTAATTPRRIIIKKRNPSSRKMKAEVTAELDSPFSSMDSTQEEEDLSTEGGEEEIAPPPLKKRLLTALKLDSSFSD